MNVREHMITPTGAFRAWATIGVFVVSVGVAVGLNITYTAQRAKDICGIIVLIDDRNQAAPPTTDPDTIRFRVELHRYRQKLGC